MADVRIGEVVTELVVGEGAGPLGPDDLRKIVEMVLEQVRRERDSDDQRNRDTAVRDRYFDVQRRP